MAKFNLEVQDIEGGIIMRIKNAEEAPATAEELLKTTAGAAVSHAMACVLDAIHQSASNLAARAQNAPAPSTRQ